MSKDNDKQNIYNQLAYILNYKPHIENQTNNFGTPPQDNPDRNTNDDLQESGKDDVTPAEAFVERVKDIMLAAEKDNGKEMENNARGYPVSYIYSVDGKGFGEVMDELLETYREDIDAYLDGAKARQAVSIKYVAPFIGHVLDTHLYSTEQMPKNEFLEVFQNIYGDNTSAVGKMSEKHPSEEAENLYKIVDEIMNRRQKR